MEYLFYILFFAVIFGAKIIKSVMEERERARSHEEAKRRGASSRPQTPRSASRKIGGYSVFGEEKEEVSAQSAEKPEDIFPREAGEFFPNESASASTQNPLGFYEERLAEAQRLIEEQNAAARRISGGIFAHALAEAPEARGFAAEIIKRRPDLAEAVILSEIIQPPLSMRRG
ncbi:MAG: hypothetical protein J6T16_06590 [Opitutales bacterium]|nr:hypothetical protein [Opitutales bacterium]